MLKKCTFTVLFTVLALAGVVNAAYSGTPATPSKDGNNCYLIGTAAELYGFAAIVNGTNDNTAEPAACGVLTADITVNENVLTSAGELNTPPEGGFTPWTPIGNLDYPFIGTFDGQGHTISGLYFNDHEGGLNVGLFGYIGSIEEPVSETVSIRNVGIEDSYFNAQSAVGGVVGYAEYVALDMKNVFNAAVVEGSSFVGGVVGFVSLDENQTSIMVNVYNVGSINGMDADAGQAGGLVGDFMNDYETSMLTIKNSYNYGDVAGGNPLVGKVENEHENVSVTNSYYLGEAVQGDYGTVKSATDFSNGTVYAALHSDEGGEGWLQYKNDAYPTFAAKTGTDAPAPMHTVVLHYSETDSVVIAYTQGTALTLPTVDREGNAIAGWTTSADGTGAAITEIPTTATTDLKLYPKVESFKPNADGYYEIATADDLYKFAEIVNNGTAPDAKVKLTEDIVVNQNVLKNASGESCVNDDGSYNTTTCPDLRVWTPIGEGSYSFNGSFDGQGHTISGLYINEPVLSESGYNALFANVGGTSVTIKNVGIEDSYFSGQRYVGGFVGRSIASSLIIENCYNAATLYGINSLGGLVGELNSDINSLTIENCYNFGTIKYNTSTGGIPTQTGALVGEDQGKTVVLNSFYLEQEGVESDFGTAATSEAFGDGTVALLLHGEGASVWGQNVETDSHPNFYKGIEGATPSENGPGVVEGESGDPLKVSGIKKITVTLHYSEEATDTSKFEHVVGIFEKLPATDKKGNFVLGWYKNASFEGDKYVEVSTAEDDLDFYAKMMKAVGGCYQIADAEMLLKFADMVNDQNEAYGDACAKLTDDIAVNKNVLANVDDDGLPRTGVSFTPWTPIGAGDSPFAGTFDGQGHTISGLYFNDGEKSSVGLFGYVAGSGKTVSISNVGVEDSYFKAGVDVGGIVGGVYDGNVTLNIENVYNAATVVVDENGYGDVGGIVGEVYNGATLNVTNAYNVGTIIGDMVGGIIGDATNDPSATSVTVNNSYNYGSVVCSREECDQGALVGYVDGANVAVTNSYYLSAEKIDGDAAAMTSTEFANRTVLAALNPAGGDAVWEQGKDYPVLLVFSNSDDEFKPNAEGYYEIASADDLYKFAAIVNNGTVPDAKAMLVADICVNACGDGESVLGENNANVNATTGEYIGSTSGLREWTPIGNWDKSFQGSFDGQGHTISGLYFNNTEAEYAGLFGAVDGTVTIDNVGLVDSYIMAGSYAGGLVGYARGSLTIINSYNASSVNAPGQTFGGLVGAASLGGSSLAISNSYNVGPLNGKGYGGGLVGFANELVVTNSYNAGSIYNSEEGAFVGGITSLVNGATTITNSFNYGSISYPSNISVTVDDLVAKVDNNAEVTVTNSFTIGESVFDGATKVTSDEFSDGTVLIALRSGDGGNVWVQNPNDKYPSIDINAKNANTIVLDWTSAADSPTLAAAGYTDGAVVIVKAGKTFYADGKIYEGILSAEQVEAIGTNKLYPVSGLDLKKVGGKLVAYLDGDSYETLMISTDVKVDSVVYTRTVENGLALTTVMLPFSVSLSSITGASKFYKFNGMDINSSTNRYEVHVSGVATDVGLVANTPYIMKPSCENGKIVLEAQGSLTLNTLNGSYVQSVNKDGVTWTMQGVYEYKVWEDGPNSELGSVYGITAENMNGAKIGEFKKLGAGASIQPMRMYLKRTVATSPRPGLTPAFARVEEGPVNIDVVVDDDEQQTMLVKRISVVPTVVKSNRWFDMKGRALGGKPTTKGTYYYNGKRIIIK